MLSFLLPYNVNVFFNSASSTNVAVSQKQLPKPQSFIKRQGPFGCFIKKAGSLSFNAVETSEGSRLFVSGPSVSECSTALSHLSRLALGLSCGFRRRLRLVGIGFRATKREISFGSQISSIHTKNYRRKRRLYFAGPGTTSKTAKQQLLTLKIGYSHESSYPISPLKNRIVKASRLEGRSKGTLISLQSNNLEQVNQVASEIRSFRLPDIYKGKGIYLDREVVKLKKGKRQG